MEHVYDVIIDQPSTTLKVPPVCTCCMEPANQVESVSVSNILESGYKTTTATYSFQFPICNRQLQPPSG